MIFSRVVQGSNNSSDYVFFFKGVFDKTIYTFLPLFMTMPPLAWFFFFLSSQTHIFLAFIINVFFSFKKFMCLETTGTTGTSCTTTSFFFSFFFSFVCETGICLAALYNFFFLVMAPHVWHLTFFIMSAKRLRIYSKTSTNLRERCDQIRSLSVGK